MLRISFELAKYLTILHPKYRRAFTLARPDILPSDLLEVKLSRSSTDDSSDQCSLDEIRSIALQ